jgi:hypothetical protein
MTDFLLPSGFAKKCYETIDVVLICNSGSAVEAADLGINRPNWLAMSVWCWRCHPEPPFGASSSLTTETE